MKGPGKKAWMLAIGINAFVIGAVIANNGPWGAIPIAVGSVLYAAIMWRGS